MRTSNAHGRRPKIAVAMPRSRVVGHIDSEARRRLGISGREMLRQYRHGKLQDIGCVADLIVRSDALADDDPIFKG